MKRLQCVNCATEFDVPAKDRPPIGCLTCGGDLRLVFEKEEPPDLPKDGNDRFSSHNMILGFVLAAWGFLTTMPGKHLSGGEKILAAYPRLNDALGLLQFIIMLNGVALFASGIALRRRQAWGYLVASGCAGVSILAGIVFFAGFQSMGTPPPNIDPLEHSVARVLLIRNNFDVIIGFVDGIGLMYYLYRHQAAQKR